MVFPFPTFLCLACLTRNMGIEWNPNTTELKANCEGHGTAMRNKCCCKAMSTPPKLFGSSKMTYPELMIQINVLFNSTPFLLYWAPG